MTFLVLSELFGVLICHLHKSALYILSFNFRTHVRCDSFVKICAATNKLFGFDPVLTLPSFSFIFCFIHYLGSLLEGQ